MSLVGLKKQLTKANQFLNEKVNKSTKSKIDTGFIESEKLIDSYKSFYEEVGSKTVELLQPNTAMRAKLQLMSKSSASYSHAETLYGDFLIKQANIIGKSFNFGGGVYEFGESFKELGGFRDFLDERTRQDYIEPMHHIHNVDLKDITKKRKKVRAQRLVLDSAKRSANKGGAKDNEEEIRVATKKFDQAKRVAMHAMNALFEKETENLQAMRSFLNLHLEYHEKSVAVMQSLREKLDTRIEHSQKNPIQMSIDTGDEDLSSESNYGGGLIIEGEFSSDENNDEDEDFNEGGNDDDDYDLGEPQSSRKKSVQSSKIASKKQSIVFAAQSPQNEASASSGNTSASPFPVSPEKSANSSQQQDTINEYDVINTKKAKLLYDCNAESVEELNCKLGDEITILEKMDEFWYKAEFNGAVGYVPIDYVEFI